MVETRRRVATTTIKDSADLAIITANNKHNPTARGTGFEHNALLVNRGPSTAQSVTATVKLNSSQNITLTSLTRVVGNGASTKLHPEKPLRGAFARCRLYRANGRMKLQASVAVDKLESNPEVVVTTSINSMTDDPKATNNSRNSEVELVDEADLIVRNVSDNV